MAFLGRQEMSRPGTCAVLAVLLCGIASIAHAADDAVRFNRDIRPILSDNCFQCHGPDAAQRQAALRLDLESAAKGSEGAGPITPGKRDESETVSAYYQ